jgi:hypothetical protein
MDLPQAENFKSHQVLREHKTENKQQYNDLLKSYALGNKNMKDQTVHSMKKERHE